MEGLGIVLASELEHLFPSDVVSAELRFGADYQVFEIDHGEGA
jgi:hypothetical protein